MADSQNNAKTPNKAQARHEENLLAPSQIKLFGRLFDGFKLDNTASEASGGNKLLQTVLQQKGARFARIYGFAYEGKYYDLPAPCIFLVHGEGTRHLEGNDTTVSKWGVPFEDGKFADDVRMWEYDKEDMSVRIDVATGFLNEVLLDYAINAQNLQTGFGNKMNVSHRGGSMMD